MTTHSKRALAAFAFLALAAAPALAHEDHADAVATSGVHGTTTTASAPVEAAQAVPQAQQTPRSAQNVKATQSTQEAKPALMFETPYQKWWTRGQD
jgi:hypothetical protein